MSSRLQESWRLTSALCVMCVLGYASTLQASSGVALAGPVPRWPLLMVAGVLGICGLLAMRLERSWRDFERPGQLVRVVGIALTSVSVFALAHGMTMAPPLYSEQGGLQWYEDFDVARAASQERGQVMMVDFTATWCNACHELDAEVFETPEVSARLEREVVLVKVDFDRAVEHQGELLARYEVTGLPRVAFVDTEGELMRAPSFEGKLDSSAFLERLDLALSGGADGAQASEFERTLGEEGLISALLLVFLAGFLSSLTPCVYPLIPITISVFGASGAKSRLHGFSLSLVYVLGIALTYSVLGVAAAMFGTVFGGAMQHPAVIMSLVVVFGVLGLSSVGLFDLRLPGDLQTKLSSVGGAGYLGAFLMGLVAGIIAAPCVGPIVAGVLLYVARQQDVVLGGGMLFVFALGLGVIFVLLGTFSSLLNKLPRAGGWMESVKVVFGAVFFGMALYYLRYVVPTLGDAVQVVWRHVALMVV